MNKNYFKSIGAIFLGMFVGAVLTVITDLVCEKIGVFPAGLNPLLYTSTMFLIALAYRIIYTVLSGYVTARFAPHSPMRHVLILGCIGIVATALGSYANWDKTTPDTTWYPVVLTLVTLPSVWLGGKMYLKKNSVTY